MLSLAFEAFAQQANAANASDILLLRALNYMGAILPSANDCMALSSSGNA